MQSIYTPPQIQDQYREDKFGQGDCILYGCESFEQGKEHKGPYEIERTTSCMVQVEKVENNIKTILARAISCSNGSLLVREPSALSVFVARRRSMPRKGWTQIEVPHGWKQLIRGVRPRSEKWPRAERNLSAAPGAGSRSQVQRGRWRQPIQRASPQSQHAATQRVLQLEAVLAAFGDSKGPEVTMLQESLRSARRAAQVPPLGVQLAQCEQFVTRAQKRLHWTRNEKVKLVSELEEGQARLRLRVETA